MANKNRSGERESYWRDVVARFGTSGLSVRAFCRREKLVETAFYFWRRTLAERDGKLPTKSRMPKRVVAAAFVPVTIRRETLPPTSGLTLELPGCGVLRFGDSMPTALIVEVIRALEARA